MLNPGVRGLAERLLPDFLVRRLDPFESSIRTFVAGVADGLPSGAVVLDAGAGECRFRDAFHRQRYIGIDSGVGDPAWDYSRLDAVAALEALPLADASCDCVLSIVVLEHTSEPQRVLDEFARVLKPGGRASMVVPHMWEEHQRPHDYFRYTSSGIRVLVERAGLQVEQVVPVGGFFWQLGRRLMGVLAFTQSGVRWVLFPFLAPLFGLVFPLACYYLDGLDRDRAYTLGYMCEARRRD